MKSFKLTIAILLLSLLCFENSAFARHSKRKHTKKHKEKVSRKVKRGKRGHKGFQGYNGPPGAQGPAGPPGGSLTGFLSAYASAQGSLTANSSTINPGSPFTFDISSANNFSNIVLNNQTSFQVANSGIYEIIFGASFLTSGTQANCALTAGGNIVATSRTTPFSSGFTTGGIWSPMGIITQLSANEIIQVVNDPNLAGSITAFDPNNGTGVNDIVCYITIKQLQ